jgi:hypothetical protein
MATTAHKHTIKSSAKAHKADKPAEPRDPAELAAMIPVDGMPQFSAVSLDKRYVPARLPTGKVIEVWGDAVMRTPEGEVHPLRPGDEVQKGDVILTAQNGIVQMEIDGTRIARLPFGSDLQGPLAQVNATDQFDAPGAGPGDPGSLSDGLRVDRVSESVTAQAFSFGGAEGGGPSLGDITPNGVLDAGNQRPAVDVQNIVVPESGVIIAAGVQPAAVTGLPGFAVFTVHLNSPAIDPVTLGLKLTAGTATLGDAAQGGDFGSSGPFQGIQVSTDDGVTWTSTDQVAVPAGATQALVRVPLHDDTLDEFNETFTLTAQSLPGSTQNVTVVANATILDNDPSPTASITSSTVAESDGRATFTVTLSAVSGKPISVDWSTADDTAKAGQDYVAAAGTLSFAPGETTKTFTVDVINDKLVEATETFFVNLSNGVNVNSDPVVTALPRAIVTIIDNDHAPVLVPQTPAAVNEDTPQTGNVLTGATDADVGDKITVVDFTVGGTTAQAGTPTTLPGIGTFVVNPDGSYTFTPSPNYDGTTVPVPPISFHATDGGNIVPGAIQLAITPVNDAPTVGAASATLSELGLATSVQTGANAIVSSGTLAISDPDNKTFSVGFDTTALPAITVGGVALHWSGNGTAASPLVAGLDSKNYLTATIDNTGNYTVKLEGPVDNPNAAGNLAFKVNVSDGVNITPSTLTVHVVDDTPHVAAAQTSVSVVQSSSDLLLVLDTSGSMATSDGVAGTRLSSAIAAFKQLLGDYVAQGDVHVRIVTFSDGATAQGAGWVTASEALTLLDGINQTSVGDKTNFAAAIGAAMTAYGTGSGTPGAKSVAYFLSDGIPTAGTEIQGPQQATWEQFLIAHSTNSLAVGFGDFQNGSGVDPLATLNAMAPVAYDASTPNPQQSTPTLVSTPTDLNNLLASTVPPPVQGFLAGSSTSTGAAGGADHAHVSAVTIDGHTFTFNGQVDTSGTGAAHQFNSSTHVLTVTTVNNGTLSIDMDDGRYGYQPPSTSKTAFNEHVTFTIADRDGSTSDLAALDINVPLLATPAAATTTAGIQAVHTGSVTALSAASTTGEALHGSPLSDVFSWTLADAGQPGAPGTTHVVGFDGQAASRGGDVLNLHDLLQGELAGPQGGVGNLGHFLDFGLVGSGGQATTTVQISSHGGFGTGQANTAATDQVIVLDHLDIRSALGLDGHAANQQIIEAMLQQGKLVVDGSNA